MTLTPAFPTTFTLTTLLTAVLALTACTKGPAASESSAQVASQAALNEQRHQTTLKKGYIALQANDLDTAEAEFKLASLLAPSNPYAFINLGVIAQTRGNLPAARNYYELARALPLANQISPTQQASADNMQAASPRAIAEANLRSLDHAQFAQSTPAVAAPVVRQALESKPVAQASAPAPTVKPAPLYTTAELNEFITGWARAWSSKNLGSYLDHYAPNFGGMRGTAPAWRASRADMFNAARTIDLQVGQPTYTQISADTVQADFSQRYSSGIYKDNGSKRMILRKIAGQWKIVSETFTAGK